jgi:hypothetical protein
MAMNDREKKLMWILGSATFLIVNAFGWVTLLNARAAAQTFQSKQESNIKKAEALKKLMPEVAQYQGYLDQWLKRYPTADDRDNYVGDLVRSSASELGLDLKKGAPTTIEGIAEVGGGANANGLPQDPAKFIKTGFSGEIVGDWQKIMEFAHRMEDASDFRWMKTADFQVRKSEGQDGSYQMALNFTLQKWWHPDSEDLLASGETPATVETPAANPSGAEKNAEQPAAPLVVPNGGETPVTQ